MGKARLRFYQELNDFLPLERRKLEFEHRFASRGSVKDMIESLGVPHTEVDVILVNGASVDFSRIVEDGDRVSVYPVFESIDITPILRLRPGPLRRTKFVLDVHLGKLARNLRMLGLDSLYRNDWPDDELADVSVNERRILLTRDRELLKRGIITHGYCVRGIHHEQQTVEVLRRFDLFDGIRPFTRCLRCNGMIEPVAKELIIDALPPRTRETRTEFHRCASCRRVFWPGTHHEAMERLIRRIMAHRQ